MSSNENKANGACCAPVIEGHRPLPAMVELSSTVDPATLQGFAKIPAGKFLMGSDSIQAFKSDGEGPVREVFVDSFFISKKTVSNSEFSEFVTATGYETQAEAFGWSFVFEGQLASEQSPTNVLGESENTPWWKAVRGASWRHPYGPESSIEGILDHPVVHVSWNDAVSYANWRGVRLPSEAEWEKAARGGLVQKNFAWGDDLLLDGKHHCNVWQGEFPVRNTCDDGYFSTAPNDSYDANAYGIYNASGNVWEWTADWMSAEWHVRNALETRFNPVGPSSGVSRVTKGGSFLCHESYCSRYRLSARSGLTPDSSLSHTGFRVAADLATVRDSAGIRR